ncbi:MAG: MotA/TolQ/ExbB proton channel family protein [Oligosphaeraceae bacterium]
MKITPGHLIWLCLCLATLLPAQQAATVDGGPVIQKLASLRQDCREWEEKEARSQESHEARMTELRRQEEALRQENAALAAEVAAAEKEVAGLRRRHQELQTARQTVENLLSSWRKGEGDGEIPLEEVVAFRKDALSRTRRALPEPGTVLTPEGLREEGLLLRFGELAYFANEREAGIVDGEGRLFRPAPDAQERIRRRLTGGEEGMVLPMPVSLTGPAGFTAPPRQSLWSHFRQGGVVMVPLGILAWLCLAVLLERLVFYARHGCAREARGLRECLAALAPEERKERQLEMAQTRLARAKRGLSLLAVSASVAPLLGLLGTVTGMIRTFQQITLHGTGDPRLLAGGISEALVTTEAGLLVAIPAMLFHAWCVRRNRRLAALLERELSRE